MTANEISVNIFPKQFSTKEKLFMSFGKMNVHGFVYASGVYALRIKNNRGEIVVLPFLGQQIWDAIFDGRNLKMLSPVHEPKITQDFLSNMGSFLFHCGASAMGSPGPKDSHPIHGELVNAKYSTATLAAGEDEKGKFIGISGEYEHSAAFGHHYLAKPLVRLYENESVVHGSMRVKNLKNTPMEFMYLAHINFLPVDYGRFVYTALYDSGHVKVRAKFPSHLNPTEKLKNFVMDLVEHPELHHQLDPEFTFDPEIVFYIDYGADKDGWAHAMHIHPDGSADFVSHQPTQLDHGVRWICRTPDQEGLGMEVGTAGVEGFTAEKEKGNIKEIKSGGEFHCEFVAGLLRKKDAIAMETYIEETRKLL